MMNSVKFFDTGTSLWIVAEHKITGLANVGNHLLHITADADIDQERNDSIMDAMTNTLRTGNVDPKRLKRAGFRISNLKSDKDIIKALKSMEIEEVSMLYSEVVKKRKKFPLGTINPSGRMRVPEITAANVYAIEPPSEKTIKVFNTVFPLIRQKLAEHGMESLMDVDFILSRQSDTYNALYNTEDDHITLHNRTLESVNAVYTIIHELGHRLEKILGMEDDVCKLFQTYISGIEREEPEINLEPGDMIMDRDDGKRYRYMGFSSKTHTFMFHEDGQEFAQLINIDPSNFTEDMSNNRFIKNDGTPVTVKLDSSYDIFPSAYSTTCSTEFFAENFLKYIVSGKNRWFWDFVQTLMKEKGVSL